MVALLKVIGFIILGTYAQISATHAASNTSNGDELVFAQVVCKSSCLCDKLI